MVLKQKEIKEAMKRGTIAITPFNEASLGINSYDVHLSNKLLLVLNTELSPLSATEYEIIEIPKEGYLLNPRQLYLASTMEYTETYGFVPYLDGRSSIGRQGLFIHVTAGRGDDGFSGYWTMELMSILPYRVYPGMPIGQLTYHQSSSIDGMSYASRDHKSYNNTNRDPMPSKIHLKDYWKRFYDVP